MTFAKIDFQYYQVSGASVGLLHHSTGSVYVFTNTFLSQEVWNNIFHGLVELNPDAKVRFSESGCALPSGVYWFDDSYY